MKYYKNEKERENVIGKCKTILNEKDKNDKKIEELAKTDKTDFAEFTLRKKLSESKTHKKYYSQFDGNNEIRSNRLIESASSGNLMNNNNYKNIKHSSIRSNKFQSNKEFLDNYTSYVRK